MKRILAFLFGWELVWTQDFDGEARLRKVYRTPFGEVMVRSILGINVKLNPDGTTFGVSYVKKWMPANKKALQTMKIKAK